MRSKNITSLAYGFVLLAIGASSGCQTQCGPQFGLVVYPIPVSPFFQDRQEDKAWMRERYDRLPIMGPITSGGPPRALDEPSQDEIIRAMEKARLIEGGIPFLHERQWNNVRMVIEPIADYVDPPRVYPLVGAAQLHHAHYKCTVYFTETTHVGWPVPYTVTDEDSVEVVYIDHNHLHLIGDHDESVTSPY